MDLNCLSNDTRKTINMKNYNVIGARSSTEELNFPASLRETSLKDQCKFHGRMFRILILFLSLSLSLSHFIILNRFNFLNYKISSLNLGGVLENIEGAKMLHLNRMHFFFFFLSAEQNE